MEKICEGCGAVYELQKIKIAMRDKDSIHCQFCGTWLIAWNGAEMYNDELISEPTKNYQPIKKN